MKTSDPRPYASSLTDPASRRFGTLSYLPALGADQIRRQVDYILARGWTPALEHVEPEHAAASYWYLWKLPLFGESQADRVLAEAAACQQAHPGHHVRLVGYDNLRQTQGTALVIRRGARS
jgi:ribulose-bisphosphate carboxylase small chain